MDIKHILKDHAYQNIPLTFEEGYELGIYTLAGCRGNALAQIQSMAVLCALHTKATYDWQWTRKKEVFHGHSLPQNAAEQIAGICAAVFEHDIAKSNYGFLEPEVPYAMDNCGMGGDLVVTANVSTIAAFIAAAFGIAMCKHGSPANADQGRHGSSDFISLLDIDTSPAKEAVEECVEQLGFGYTDALDVRYKRIHLQTHKFAKLPHMNDIIGPITNPLNPNLLTHRVLGVNHLLHPRLVAQAYCLLNERGTTHIKHALIVRGFVNRVEKMGVDELSICPAGSLLVELRDGEMLERWLYAKDFGLKPVRPDKISPPKGMSKGDFSLKILKKEISGAPVEMILANAALLFYLGGYSQDFAKCCQMARDVYEDGLAYKKVLAVQARLPSKP